MKIQFIGACHEVTGSCTLLEVDGRQYLVDCGMEQGIDMFENIPIPVPAGTIDAVFLTHAHIDHSGMLPKLYKDGFRGKIYATEATCDLCNIMLRDSAHIQESEAEWRSRKAERAGEMKVEPIYTTQDALGAISCFRRCKYDEIIRIAEGVEVRFTDIGHLLGSACIELWLTEEEEQRKIVFSGDVGNYDQPIIKDPKRVPDADYVVIESTYGNRLHERTPQPPIKMKSYDAVRALADYIQKAFDRGGSVIIPAFAVGRTQEMLYAIREIKQYGLVHGHDGFPVYVDSPLAVEATGVFLQCDLSCLDEETLELVNEGVNPLWFDGLTLAVSAEESKAINADRRPKVILSASGMCEAGRIRHHLKHNLWQKNNIILFVGYQAEGSLGRKLQDGAHTVRLFGEDILVAAEIAALRGTSGHADQAGLVDWLEGFIEKPRVVYINHGADESTKAFQELLNEKGYTTEAPYSGTEYDLLTGRMTVFADARPISRAQVSRGHARAQSIFRELISAAEALLALCYTRKGCTNKENAKLTSQILNLIQKWKD